MANSGDGLVAVLTRPLGAAKRLLDAAAASTDPEYLKRKFKSKPKMPPRQPYDDHDYYEPVKK
jgi:hypothetical protein